MVTLSGGVVAGDSQVEGFVTPRSQQGLPTIAEVVEGFPFFRVARTEVMQALQYRKAHTPHHHEQSHHNHVIVPAALEGNWLWEKGVWVRRVARHHT